jgi:Domain of unknown function (DUF3291)
MEHSLAQLNVARLKAPLDSPVMAEFVARLEAINRLADAAPGFIWRLQSDEGDATALRPMGEDMLVNMSVWADAEALADFVYRTAHSAVMRRRRDWFERLGEAYLVLWWVPAGHRPSIEEAIARLELLRGRGPSPEAFNFRALYGPDGSPARDTGPLRGPCPAT